ncbi:MAG: response regulator transcription factor [Solirubrobacteraceae bacterium]|nr:response regulator transcription factor [Solirubrobacteraceae bacterium]
MTAPMRPTVLLVEDESSIAVPFASALRREGFEPVIAATAKEARAAWRVSRPAVVLLDLTLPDGDGRQLVGDLRGELGDVPVIMVTARGTETDRIVGLELGADDYVVKPFSSAEVAARIRAVLRRAATSPAGARDEAERLEADGLVIDLAARTVVLDGAPIVLSRKEFDLLARLAGDAGRTVTREALMRDVWDENWFGSTKTLDVHIAAVRRHLGDDAASPRFIHTVRGVGFRFAASPAPGVPR